MGRLVEGVFFLSLFFAGDTKVDVELRGMYAKMRFFIVCLGWFFTGRQPHPTAKVDPGSQTKDL